MVLSLFEEDEEPNGMMLKKAGRNMSFMLCSCRLSSSSLFMFLRQTGHVACILSHWLMHGSWNKCLHGSCLADSVRLKSSMQTAHWEPLSSRIWSIMIMGRFFIWSSLAGAGPLFVFLS